MKIAVLFDGAGLARLGLERAGHICTGYELNPVAHHLSKFVGSGNSVLADVRDVDLSGFDAVWASPPCQWRSAARTQGDPTSEFATDLLDWSLSLPHSVLWVENVMPQGKVPDWGTPYNAAQFEQDPRQNRNRMIGGRHTPPKVYRSYQRGYPQLDICPAVTATEFRGCGSDKRRASRYYGRKLTLWECGYHMGFAIPVDWANPLPGYTQAGWMHELYRAVGNGVPTYMARAFGQAYPVAQVARKRRTA